MLATQFMPMRLGTRGFNPGVCQVGDDLRVAFRVDPHPGRGLHSTLWLGRLDKHWQSLGHKRFRQGCEDPRLFTIGDDLYCSYTRSHLGRCSMAYCKFSPQGELEWEQRAQYGKPPEKNWVFFGYQGQLHCVYSASPHVVLLLGAKGEVIEKWETEWPADRWNLGEPRGGTPPVLMGDVYLSFFHSHLPKTKYRGGRPAGSRRRHYYTGAYAFEAEPPFKVRGVTKEPLIEPWSHPTQRIVTSGAIREDNQWRLFYGQGNRSGGTCVVNHAALMIEMGLA